MALFIQTQKKKQLSMKVTLMMYLNQYILQSFGKGSGYIIDSFIDHNISISRYNPYMEAVIYNYQKN